MIRRPPRSTLSSSSAASDVYKRQVSTQSTWARLAFSIATITKPDILIVDEILSVGDFLFQEKCEKRIKELMDGGTTVIIVSHSIDQIERLCKNVLWLEKGNMKMLGEMEEVCEQYKKSSKN
eukprot:TRINITY_DN1420_c0_g1_i5.p1 TRINITY_DN1420_c0_g1~~TRINITY_DN1420_c0_g1_i5.p1  ORF type:complete len:130 (+),score=26.79 TRINITY_DN1420_c0_g1_i5:25-390(+)